MPDCRRFESSSAQTTTLQRILTEHRNETIDTFLFHRIGFAMLFEKCEPALAVMSAVVSAFTGVLGLLGGGLLRPRHFYPTLFYHGKCLTTWRPVNFANHDDVVLSPAVENTSQTFPAVQNVVG